MNSTEFKTSKEQLSSDISTWLSTHINPYDRSEKERAYWTIYHCSTLIEEMYTVETLRAIEQIFNQHKFIY